MYYKTIIKSQRVRFAILRVLHWIPDSIMLRIQYRIKMGFWPDFKHPKRFTEKLQLYKMKYRNPLMHQCVDKYQVRRHIENKGLGHILNILYGVYDSPDDINFSSLPKEFVIKTSDGGGGLNVIIVKDKETIDINAILQKLSIWLKQNKDGAKAGREWAYLSQFPPRIIIEQYLEDYSYDINSFTHDEISSPGLTDYKFFCFNGRPFCVQVDSGRFNEHRQNFYDMQWNSIGVHCTYPEGTGVKKPESFDEMKLVASQLASDFPFVRVDLYDVKGRVYFGELTFYPSSGYGSFKPDSFDYQLGNCFTEYS